MVTTKPITYRHKLEHAVQSEIVGHLAKHVITAKKVDGVYGHWRCQEPGTWNHGFDIVTWPGSLCFTGDMGDYLFQRTTDMVAFMRQSAMSFGYAAEKCVAHDGRLKEWREELFHEELAERLNDVAEAVAEDFHEQSYLDEVRKKMDHIRRAYAMYNSEHDAIQAMYESGLWDDLPTCKAYTYHFLWALHAIKWFCDNVK